MRASLPEDKEVYVHQPRGFNRGQDCVLKLSKSLYGMCKSPRHFFKYLTERLIKHGLKPSELDPCMFVTTNPGNIDGTPIETCTRTANTVNGMTGMADGNVDGSSDDISHQNLFADPTRSLAS